MGFYLHRLLPNRLPTLGSSKPRIAQLTSRNGFQAAELFPPSRWRELNAFAPQMLAGSAADLQRLVERLDLGTLELDSVDHSICVVTDVGDKPISDVLRVVLWQRFGVPVYEVLTDGSGALLAYECENHDGMHAVRGVRFAVIEGELVLQTASGTGIHTGLIRRLDSALCPCGRPGLRIVEPSTMIEPAGHLLAAIA